MGAAPSLLDRHLLQLRTRQSPGLGGPLQIDPETLPRIPGCAQPQAVFPREKELRTLRAGQFAPPSDLLASTCSTSFAPRLFEQGSAFADELGQVVRVALDSLSTPLGCNRKVTIKSSGYLLRHQVLLHPTPMRGLRPGYVGIPRGSLARFLNQCSRQGVLLGLRPLRTEALGRPLLGEFPVVQGHGPWLKPMSMPRVIGTPVVASHREPQRHLCGIQRQPSRRATQRMAHTSAQLLTSSWSVVSRLFRVRANSVCRKGPEERGVAAGDLLEHIE